MAEQKFKTLKFGTYVKEVLEVQPGRAHHGHCAKCGACLLSERKHYCPGVCTNWNKDRFWMKAIPSASRGHKTTKPKTHFNGIPIAKVARLADEKYHRPLSEREKKAVQQFFDQRFSNMGLSEHRGEPVRPVLSVVEESYESRVRSIDPLTGKQTAEVTVTCKVETKVSLRTVTSHAWALAKLGEAPFADDADDAGVEPPVSAPTGYFSGHV